MGNGKWGRLKRIITNAQCPMPNAQCPMPHAQLPITNHQQLTNLQIAG
jgi:hypothetical protein